MVEEKTNHEFSIDKDDFEYDVGDKLSHIDIDDLYITIKDIVYSANSDKLQYVVLDSISNEIEYRDIDLEKYELKKYDIQYSEDLIHNKLYAYHNDSKYTLIYLNENEQKLQSEEHEYKTTCIRIMDIIKNYEIKLTKDSFDIISIDIKDKYIYDGTHYNLINNE